MTIAEKINRLIHHQCSTQEALEVAVATDEGARKEFVWALNFIEALRMAMPDEIDGATSSVTPTNESAVARLVVTCLSCRLGFGHFDGWL